MGWKTIISAIVIAICAILKAFGIGTEGVEGTADVVGSWITIIQQIAAAFGLFGLRDAIAKK